MTKAVQFFYFLWALRSLLNN